MTGSPGPTPYLDPSLHTEGYYRELERKNVLRLILTYVAPLVILSAYFYFQYRSILQQGTRNHLRTVAESHARTMDLFLQERISNLSNLIDDPRLAIPPEPAAMRDLLDRLVRDSETFVDIGFLNAAGIQIAYAGPHPELSGRDYSREPWLLALKTGRADFLITDCYPGFRGRPHFTLAVRRVIHEQDVVLRAALDPEQLHRYLTSLADTRQVELAVVNPAGYFQMAAPPLGRVLEKSPLVPPESPAIATRDAGAEGTPFPYAYAWLRSCNWAMIAMPAADAQAEPSANASINIIAFSAAIIALILSVSIIRAKRIVQTIRQADTTRAQMSDNLIHASRLVAVGELASGIAHEINNPLAIINEEVGLIKDMSDPKFSMDLTLQDVGPHLDAIQDAVFRCRDITGKLLAFVRKGQVTVQDCDLHELIDEVVNGFYGREIALSDIQITRSYCREHLSILADKTQLEQVFLNIINNAIDAISGPGAITITTTLLWEDDRVRIDIEDTGIGMTQDQLEKIFLPFYTTKEAGKGTGLGLSISYAIIRSMGGEVSVVSTFGKGSTFSITLPARVPAAGPAAS